MSSNLSITQIKMVENWNTLVKNKCSLTPLSLNPSLGNILQKTFNYKFNYLLLESKNKIVAFLPVVLLKNKIISFPHFSYGFVFTDEVIENDNCFIDNMDFIFDNQSQKKYELRSFSKLTENTYIDKVLSYINLNNQNIIFSSFKSNHRRKIRKSIKNGLTIKQGKTELLKDFYDVLCKNSHRLGAPVLPISFFRNLLTDYKYGDSLVFITYLNGKAIGSAFLLSYNGFYENIWFATIKKYNHLYTSYLLHWTMIKYACDKAAKIYSFGRSTKDSGVHNFKKHWGTKDKQLYWNYSHPKKFDLRKHNWIKEIWKLLPLPVAKWIGPYFAKKVY